MTGVYVREKGGGGGRGEREEGEEKKGTNIPWKCYTITRPRGSSIAVSIVATPLPRIYKS